MTDALREHEVPEGEFSRWASVAMLDALHEIQRPTAHDLSDLGGLFHLMARRGITRAEKALAGLSQD